MAPAWHWPEMKVLPDYVLENRPSPTPQDSLTLKHGFHGLFTDPLVSHGFGRAPKFSVMATI